MDIQQNTVFLNLIKRILEFRCSTLEGNDKKGIADYIFELKKNGFKNWTEGSPSFILRGTDFLGRDFIAFQCVVVYSSGYLHEVNMFSIFLKRFANNNLVWHCVGHDDAPILFDTAGGASVEQVKLIETLLYDGYVDVSEDLIYNNSIQIKHRLLNNVNETPVGIRLIF